MERQTIMWEITLNCNLSCGFCLSWERRKQKYWKITFEEAIKIVNNLPLNAHISFIWWESFLFPGYMDILKNLDERWITYEITTNWTLVDKFLDEINNLKNLTNIYFSIDWFWDAHDKVRWQRWLFDKIIRLIPKINKKIYINTVILENTNFDDLVKLYKLFLKLNIAHLRLAYCTNFTSNDIKESIEKVPELIIKMKFEEWINNIILRNKTLLYIGKLNIINKKLLSNMTIDLNPVSIIRWYPKSCKSLEKYYRINENWRLTICHFIDNEFNSLIENSFEEIIKDKEYLLLKNKIKNVFPLKICNTCWKWT